MKGDVLVVEDEAAQAEVLCWNLTKEGFDVRHARDGAEAMLLVDEAAPDVVVLDWMIPEVSGIEVCRRLKARRDAREIAVIMLSARSEEGDRVRGLTTGADDYMVKPYSVAELIARVRTQLKRLKPEAVGEVLRHEDITLDAEAHRVHRGSREVKLGPLEFRLLATMIARPGRVWSRDELLSRVWGRDALLDTRTVDVHVGRLRKALTGGGEDDPLRTVRGAGYALG